MLSHYEPTNRVHPPPPQFCELLLWSPHLLRHALLPPDMPCCPLCTASRSTGKSLCPAQAWPASVPHAALTPSDHGVVERADKHIRDAIQQFDAMEMSRGIEAVMNLLRDANAYFAENEPWKLKPAQAANGTAYHRCSPPPLQVVPTPGIYRCSHTPPLTSRYPYGRRRTQRLLVARMISSFYCRVAHLNPPKYLVLNCARLPHMSCAQTMTAK